MSTPYKSLFLSILSLLLLKSSLADVGTASRYAPPYLPTACSGNSQTQFPSNNFFAAAGTGIWDNGASCGREYLLRCISAAGAPGTCTDSTIRVKIVDRADTSVSRAARPGATIVLSTTAFNAIAKPSATFVNIEYVEV